ncbi:MAG: hypothetical protein AAF657_41785, partial [Acidobacteriota bacterium]
PQPASRPARTWPACERRRRVERPRRHERRRHLQPIARKLYASRPGRRSGDLTASGSSGERRRAAGGAPHKPSRI